METFCCMNQLTAFWYTGRSFFLMTNAVELVLTWIQVYPSVLGDDNPRLYIYATVSTYPS